MRIIKLEDRIVLDGALSQEIGSVEDAVAIEAQHELPSEVQDAGAEEVFHVDQLESTGELNIVLIASDLEDSQILENAFENQANTMAVYFDVDHDSPAMIIDTLEKFVQKQGQSIENLSLLSHGDKGQFKFGNEEINLQNVKALSSLQKVISETGSIKIYSCNTSGSDQGVQLINVLSDLTGATVYASDDITGKKGDWDLEVISGDRANQTLDTNEALVQMLNAYQGSLVNPISDAGATTPDFWLRASDLSAGSVTEWGDVNDPTLKFTSTTTAPVYEASGINSLPSVKFESSAFLRDQHATKLMDVQTGDGFTLFMVAETFTTASGGKYLWSGGILYRLQDMNGSALYVNTGGNGGATSDVDYKVTANNAFVGAVNAKDGTNLILFEDHTTKSTTVTGDFTPRNGTDYIGAKNGNNPWDGYISEIIFYETALDAVEHAKVENYLFDKYNITGDKYIYDDTGNVHNASDGLAGIGKLASRSDDYSDNTSGILTIQGADSLDADDFLMFNHDNANTTAWTSTDSPTLTQRIAREWRVDITNDPGKVDLRFDVSGLDTLPTGYTEYVVMIDKDGNFHNSTGSADEMTQVLHLTNMGGNVYGIDDVTLQSGEYITLGTQQSAPPIITLSTNSISFTEDGPKQVLDGAVTITDADTPTAINGATLEMDFVANGDSGDRLFFETGGGLTIDGTDIKSGATVIGTVTSDGVGSNKLIATFNANASMSQMQTLAQNVYYQNTSQNPTDGGKVMRIIARDGEGARVARCHLP